MGQAEKRYEKPFVHDKYYRDHYYDSDFHYLEERGKEGSG